MPGTASYTQRSLEHCRAGGWRVGRVDRRTPPAPGQPRGKSHDLFGVADLACVVPGEAGITFVQSTSLGQVTAHIRRYAADPKYMDAIRALLLAGNVFVIWGWWRRPKPIQRKSWTFREVAYAVTADGEVFIALDIKDALA